MFYSGFAWINIPAFFTAEMSILREQCVKNDPDVFCCICGKIHCCERKEKYHELFFVKRRRIRHILDNKTNNGYHINLEKLTIYS